MPPRDPLDDFRCLYCLALATIVLARMPADFRFLRARGSTRGTPRLLGRWQMPRLAAGPWLAGSVALVLVLAATGASLIHPGVLWFASVVSLFHFAQLADSPTVHRKANTVPVILGLLAADAVSTGGDPAVVSTAVRIVIKLLMVQVFFSAAIAKLRASGWGWTDGQTLRHWCAYYHLRDGGTLTLKLASSLALCRAVATCALGFELTFWLVLVVPALAWLYVPAALTFHIATACLFRIHYVLYLGPAYLVFVAEALDRHP